MGSKNNSNFSRIISLASKALGSKGGSGSGGSGGGTDWRDMVRSAADAVTGDSRRGTAPQRPDDRHTEPWDAAPGGYPAQPGYPAPGGYPAQPGYPAPGAAYPAQPAYPTSGGYPAPAVGVSGAPGLQPPSAGATAARGQERAAALSPTDRAAIARYDYLMQTADPQRIEAIHRDAFGRLTPAQRAEVQARMAAELPPYEQPRSSSAADLARAAARTEAASPGRMRGLLSRAGRGAAIAGAGGAAVGVLGLVAGGAMVSAAAGPLLAQASDLGVDFGALAEGIDLGALTGGAEGILGAAGEQVAGLGEQVGGWADQLGNFGIPGIGDIFGR